MYQGVNLTDLDALPDSFKIALLTEFETMSWMEESNGSISSLGRFDTMYPPWYNFLDFLFSSPLRNSDFVAHIFYGLSGEMCEYARYCFETPPPPDAFTAIKNWPWTKQVIYEDTLTLIVRMEDLQSSLSFILNLYENLPCEKSIERHPDTLYTATLAIRFKNLHVFVDLHRHD